MLTPFSIHHHSRNPSFLLLSPWVSFLLVPPSSSLGVPELSHDSPAHCLGINVFFMALDQGEEIPFLYYYFYLTAKIVLFF